MNKDLLVEANRQGWYTDRSPLGHWICHAPGGAWHIVLAPNGDEGAGARNAIVRMARLGFERRGRVQPGQLWTLDIEADVVSGRYPSATQWSDTLLAAFQGEGQVVGTVTFANAASRQVGARFCLEAEDAAAALAAAERLFAQAVRRSGLGEVILRKVELER